MGMMGSRILVGTSRWLEMVVMVVMVIQCWRCYSNSIRRRRLNIGGLGFLPTVQYLPSIHR